MVLAGWLIAGSRVVYLLGYKNHRGSHDFSCAASIASLSRLAGEGEGGPERWIGKIFRMQQGQLRFTPRLGAGFARAPAFHELGHQLVRSFVVDPPMAGEDAFR